MTTIPKPHKTAKSPNSSEMTVLEETLQSRNMKKHELKKEIPISHWKKIAQIDRQPDKPTAFIGYRNK
jgi:hypothetical protein